MTDNKPGLPELPELPKAPAPKSQKPAEPKPPQAEPVAAVQLPELPSLDQIKEQAKKRKIKTSAEDIDLTMPDAWLNQYSLTPMFYTTKAYYIFMTVTAVLVAYAGAVWFYQIYYGMGVAGLKHPVFWGVYIAVFIFWAGLSISGTVISAILRLAKANWRRPVLRGAEVMTAFAVMVAGVLPLAHIGRLERVYYMFPLPNQRELWLNYRSPLTWDMTALGAYLAGSLLFLFIGLLPDIALARDLCPKNNWRKGYLTYLSLGWRGTQREWHVYEKASTLMAVHLLCIAPMVHTILSWDFAAALTPGWHTSILGPFFVIGAIYSGIAGVISLMVVLRWIFSLDEIIKIVHLKNLAKLLFVVTIMWLYFYFNEFMVAWYAHEPMEWNVWQFQGTKYLWHHIFMFGSGIAVLIFFSNDRFRSRPLVLLLVTLYVNAAMIIERFMIVVPPLSRRDDPYMWTTYFPTWVEFSINAGALFLFLFLYGIFIKILPVVTVADIREGNVISGDLRIGNTYVRVQAKVED